MIFLSNLDEWYFVHFIKLVLSVPCRDEQYRCTATLINGIPMVTHVTSFYALIRKKLCNMKYIILAILFIPISRYYNINVVNETLKMYLNLYKQNKLDHIYGESNRNNIHKLR